MDLEATIGASAAPDPARPGVPAAGQIANLRDRIVQQPGNPGPRIKLASLLQAEGRKDEAVSVLSDTIDCFPKNTKAREQLKALLEKPFQRPAAEPFQRPAAEPIQRPAAEPFQRLAAEPFQRPAAEPFQHPAAEPFQHPAAEPFQHPAAEPFQRPAAEPFQRPAAEPFQRPAAEPFQHPAAEPVPFPALGILPKLTIAPPIETMPAGQGARAVAAGLSVVQEPRRLPIRLSGMRPGAEWMAGGVILLILGLVWQAWRLLPENHLLQKPAVIMMQGAIPAVSSVVADILLPPLPVFVQAEPPVLVQPQPAVVAEAPKPPLPEAMPQRVVILRARHDTASSQAALRLAARLEAQHFAVSPPVTVAGAGRPGIGYFYAEDLPEAEALSRRMPDIAGKLRLISGAARTAQQPGAVAIVMP